MPSTLLYDPNAYHVPSPSDVGYDPDGLQSGRGSILTSSSKLCNSWFDPNDQTSSKDPYPFLVRSIRNLAYPQPQRSELVTHSTKNLILGYTPRGVGQVIKVRVGMSTFGTPADHVRESHG